MSNKFLIKKHLETRSLLVHEYVGFKDSGEVMNVASFNHTDSNVEISFPNNSLKIYKDLIVYGNIITPNQIITEKSLPIEPNIISNPDPLSPKVIGKHGHAEGAFTIAEGTCSHAEGFGVNAKGYYSHAEGYRTLPQFGVAEGLASHIQGLNTFASGIASHAAGEITEARGNCSTVCGRLASDAGFDHCFVFGDGTKETFANDSEQFVVRAGGGFRILSHANCEISTYERGNILSWSYTDDTELGNVWLYMKPRCIHQAIKRIAEHVVKITGKPIGL